MQYSGFAGNGHFGISDFIDHKILNEAYNILLEGDFYYNYNYILTENYQENTHKVIEIIKESSRATANELFACV